jgi:hypothetical protein
MKYIEISLDNSMSGFAILKKKNIIMVLCHTTTGSNQYHIEIQFKIGEPLIRFYETEEKMMEEYRHIHDSLFNH